MERGKREGGRMEKAIIEEATVGDVVEFLVGNRKGVVEGVSVTIHFRAAGAEMNIRTCLSSQNTAFVEFLKSKRRDLRRHTLEK